MFENAAGAADYSPEKRSAEPRRRDFGIIAWKKKFRLW